MEQPESTVDIQPLPEKPKRIFPKKTKEVHERTPAREETYKKWHAAGKAKRESNKLKAQQYDELFQNYQNANKKIQEYENIIQLLSSGRKTEPAPVPRAESKKPKTYDEEINSIFNKFY
jgi:hypothetical protein